jgi:predicted nucleotidyltransferase
MKTLATSAVDIETQNAVRQFAALVAQHHYPVEQTILFGSRARGDAHDESDADVALILSGQIQPFIKTKMEMNDLAYDVLLDTGIRISPLPIWESQWSQPNTYSNPRLLHNVERDGVWL